MVNVTVKVERVEKRSYSYLGLGRGAISDLDKAMGRQPAARVSGFHRSVPTGNSLRAGSHRGGFNYRGVLSLCS